jgi:hypothetical protein
LALAVIVTCTSVLVVGTLGAVEFRDCRASSIEVGAALEVSPVVILVRFNDPSFF